MAAKYPHLYQLKFWDAHAHKTDVEIGREFDIPHSTVRAARRRMGVKPISVSEASKRTWRKGEFRKKRSKFPLLYEKGFWSSRRGFTNSEIARQLGCASSTVKKAREALRIRSLSRSEAQTRRFDRDIPKSEPGRRKKRGPMLPDIRAKSLQRADGCCEIPICDSHYNLVLLAISSDTP